MFREYRAYKGKRLMKNEELKENQEENIIVTCREMHKLQCK